MTDHTYVKRLDHMRPQRNIPPVIQESTTKQFDYFMRRKVILDMSVFEMLHIALYRRVFIATYSGNYHSAIPDIVSPYHRHILHIISSSTLSSVPTTV